MKNTFIERSVLFGIDSLKNSELHKNDRQHNLKMQYNGGKLSFFNYIFLQIKSRLAIWKINGETKLRRNY
ncbi:hypothetical protein H8S90_14655 [Olivibacter sp. SDN3]|uniref:hypothetical protein n=1 Tax=Olivibacter sp. SDN3 TaxID=2764720 RepID=UPI001651A5DD|nr:hypothetical protein [Olivibacter sp. SDN3]QNL48046.1 hypothetical protein H8S90_14655 [Olivibacter sp. SDN3]